MRISFVLPYAGMAGGIRVVAIYADRLRRRGHEVFLVSTTWVPPGRRGAAQHAMRKLWKRINRVSEDHHRSHLDGLGLNHVRIDEMRPVTDQDLPDADVVVATWWETASWVAKLSPSKGAKAYFVQDYGAHEGQPIEHVAATWRLPLHKIAISKWIISLIEHHSGCAGSGSDAGGTGATDYVPNAVDLELFNAPRRGKRAQPTVGFLYNPAPQKGCDLINDAIADARRSQTGLNVLAYGLGDPEPDLPLPAGTAYWSYAPDRKLKEIYAGCDAWLFGSRLEGFGLPIVEAMACRTPVIATPAGAAPELLAGGGGILLRSIAAEEMATAIERIAAMTDEEWRAMSEAAYATVCGYTWEDATDRFEAALRRAMAVPAARSELTQA